MQAVFVGTTAINSSAGDSTLVGGAPLFLVNFFGCPELRAHPFL